MMNFFGMMSEDKKNTISSVKKYIAAGVSVAAFIFCAAIGASNTVQPEAVPAETDVIPAETAAAETVCAARSDIDVFAQESSVGVLEAGYPSSYEYYISSCGEAAANTAVSETEADVQDGEETAAAAENAYEDNADDTYGGSEEIFCEDAVVPTGSFAEETVTSAKVKSISAKTSDEKMSVRVVVPEMSQYSDDDIESFADKTVADEPLQEEEEYGAYDGEEIFADEPGSALPVDPDAVDRVSKFEVPEWLKLDESGVPAEYIDAITGKSCAYTAEPDALMSTGKTVFQGYVAVDPDIIPYGSELYIIAEDGEVYGYAIAADTGYSVREGHIVVDLFMDEYDDCIEWGAKNVTIYVLRTNDNEE